MKPLYGHPRSWNESPPDLDAVQAWGLDSLEGARSQGFSSLLVQASMGTGKTVLAAKHAKAIEKQGRRVVFLCHLRTLVEQAAEKFEAWGVDVQIEQGRHKARSHFGRPSHIIASKDSLHPNRIEDFIRRSGLSGVEVEVIYDECHLATTPSWSRPVQGLRPVFTIGLSGTPIASNGRKLYGPGAPFQALCCRYDFLTACRHRNLVPPVLVECGVTVDLRDIKITRQAGGRDYDLKELTLRINESLGTLIRAAKERIIEWEVKRFLQFLPDVGVCRAAERMWSGMRKPDGSPYRVRAIYHGLPDADEVKRSYHRGDLDGLLSCQMLDVGFDDPPTDGIILSTPTKSAVKILQQGGRGSRLFPGKDRYVIIGYRWETADEGPQSTLDLLLRGIPDERTRSLVCDLMRGPGRLNFLEAVERAEIERRREIAEDRRRYGDLPVACVDAPVDHTVRVMDLVQGVSVHDAHTMKQLKRCGLTNPEIIRMTPREADRFLDRWVNGRDSTLATYKQVQALLRMGISERDALPLTKRQAQGLIFKGLPPKPAAWSHV
jgi:superfamily II DNA or RNA helicase